MIVTLRYSSPEVLYAKLEQLGMKCNPSARAEEQIPQTSTPELVTLVGIVRSVWFTDEQYAMLPSVTSPDFLIDWSEDCEDENGNPLPWPEYTMADGSVCGAGRFA